MTRHAKLALRKPLRFPLACTDLSAPHCVLVLLLHSMSSDDEEYDSPRGPLAPLLPGGAQPRLPPSAFDQIRNEFFTPTPGAPHEYIKRRSLHDPDSFGTHMMYCTGISFGTGEAKCVFVRKSFVRLVHLRHDRGFSLRCHARLAEAYQPEQFPVAVERHSQPDWPLRVADFKLAGNFRYMPPTVTVLLTQSPFPSHVLQCE